MIEDELDLRRYFLVIRRWLWLIVGCTLLAAVTALIVSLLLPPTYEASAVVVVTQLRYQMQFDPRFESVEQWTPAYKAFPRLASSDEVLQGVLDIHTPSPAARIEEWTLTTLAEMVEATSEGDPSLVVLKVSSRSPQDAADIANAWAGVFAEHGDEIYSASEEDIAFFESRVADAEQALDEADAALVAFQARNQASIVSAQLNSTRQTQSDYLADQRGIGYLVQDIQGLRDQLARQPGDRAASLADDLTTLLLQIKAFSAGAATPIQLQVASAESLSGRNLAEQVAFLGDLVGTLEAKSDEIDERLAALEPQSLDLQQQLEAINAEGSRLTLARDLARETYTTLARKLDEARIAAREEGGMLRVGSHAAVPEEPAGPRKLLNTALAGVVGLMLGVGGAFALEWWQQGAEQGGGERKT